MLKKSTILATIACAVLALPLVAAAPASWVADILTGSSMRLARPSTTVPVARKFPWWQEMHDDHVRRAQSGNIGLLFLGDSITQGMDGVHPLMNQLWGQHKPLNFGIGGDTTEHLLWRLQNGELDGIKPNVVVVLIGTNNLGINKDDEIVAGIRANVDEIRQRLPQTKILVLGILPRGHNADDLFRGRIKHINSELEQLSDGKNVFYTDAGPQLVEPDGTISPSVMSDYLHPGTHGYDLMFHAIKPTVDKLLNS